MDSFIASGIVWAVFTLICITLGIVFARRRTRLSRAELQGRVICSLCGGWLDGLEQFCPHCGKNYAIELGQIEMLAQSQKTCLLKKDCNEGNRLFIRKEKSLQGFKRRLRI